MNSPFLHLTPAQQQSGISDEAYERIPQQIMSLLKLGDARYVIFAYGQSLRPAPGSIVQTAGPFFGICTNYAITGEFATRSVVRVDNRPTPGVPLSNDLPTKAQPSPSDRRPRVVVESYSILPPD